MQTNLLSAQQNEQTESVSPQDVVKHQSLPLW